MGGSRPIEIKVEVIAQVLIEGLEIVDQSFAQGGLHRRIIGLGELFAAIEFD